jgi:hypothetical protein
MVHSGLQSCKGPAQNSALTSAPPISKT